MNKQPSHCLHVTNQILVITFAAIIIIIIISNWNYIYYLILLDINSRTTIQIHKTRTSAPYGSVRHYYKKKINIYKHFMYKFLCI
jgi:hypothetical protein